jgi:hypothetical protein
MKLITLKLSQNLSKISLIVEKSAFIMLILAIVWQSFPRVTSLAQTLDPNDLANTGATAPAVELTKEERMISIIKGVASQEGYANVNLVIGIAKAESRLNPDIRGEQDKRDRGLYQINSHFNAGVSDECAFDPVCSTRWTINELKAGHAWKWNASKYKWANYAYNK